MNTDTYALIEREDGFGLRIESAAEDTVEFPCISYSRDLACGLITRMRKAQPEPVHYGDIVRDFITEQYLSLLALNGL